MKYAARFMKPVSIKNEWCRLLRKTEGVIYGLEGQGVGIDPGVNFGISIIRDENVTVYHGALRKETKPGRYGFVTYKFFQDAFAWCHGICTIEGAAYGSKYGQPLLAEVRTGFYLAASLWSKFSKVTIVPPATIRKTVFENGKFQAADRWPILNHNGADALSMAVYSLREKG